MSQIERSPSDYIMPPRSLAQRLAAANGHAGAAVDEAAVSAMAQRFAPELQIALQQEIKSEAPEMPKTEIPRHESPRPDKARVLAAEPMIIQPAHGGIWSKPILQTAFIMLALVPLTTFAFLVWQGAIPAPWPAPSLGQPDSAKQPTATASLAGANLAAPERDAKPATVALTLPETLQAEPGKEIDFAIAIDSDGKLPLRSTITIGGLAEGMTFSAGRPFGSTEWSLKPDEIGDLKLKLPQGSGGQRELSIALITADGTTIAAAATRLDVAVPGEAPLVSRPNDAGRIADLIAHGRKMIEVGYLAGARSYYRRAAEAGSGEAAFALGATYDPALIEEMGAQGIKPDAAEARVWYARAKALGAKDADAQIARLDATPVIEPAAAIASAASPAAPQSVPAPDQTPHALASKAEGGAGDLVELSGSANLRQSPSSTSPTIRVVERGTKVRALGKQGGWIHVSDPATQEQGWVYSRYVAGMATP